MTCVFFLQFGYYVAQPHFGFFSWIWIGYLNCTKLAARSLVLNLSFLGEDGSKFLWTLKLCHAMSSCGGLNGLYTCSCYLYSFHFKVNGFRIPIVFLQKIGHLQGSLIHPHITMIVWFKIINSSSTFEYFQSQQEYIYIYIRIYIWSNYSDLTRVFGPQKVFLGREIPPRSLKYYKFDQIYVWPIAASQRLIFTPILCM